MDTFNPRAKIMFIFIIIRIRLLLSTSKRIEQIVVPVYGNFGFMKVSKE